MKKITLEEKIELITAYAEGKPVEDYDTIFRQWFEKGTDTWDFDRVEYRIKPEASTKFAVGDVVVREDDEDWMMPDRRTIERLDKDICRFADGSDIKTADLDRHYINERDVLWYFEFYDYASKKYSMHPTRASMNEMDEEFGAHYATNSWKPIYNLGFKLKED